jgi:hypothetical protein
MSETAGVSGPTFSCPRRYELGKPWWNDISRGKFLILPLELSVAIIPAKSFSSNTGVIGEGNDEFCLDKNPFNTSKGC